LGDSISGRNNCHATEKGDELTPFHGCSSAIIALSEILALQLPFLTISESMGNHDSKIVDAGSVD
jgi:hypothetical protein